MPSPTLLQRLKERKLVQWALAYLAGAFVVFQLLDALETPLGLTAAVQRAILVVVGIGFLITLVLAWYHGEKGRQKVSGPELLMVAALLVVAGVALSVVGGPEGTEILSVGREGDDRPGIAILPCENLSTDPEDEYLAVALHDEILLKIQEISSLFSTGRASVEWYTENPAPLTQVARELGVGFVGECSVQKHGEQIRLIFQLLHGGTGGQLWAENYDRDLTLGNLLDIQSDVAQQVAHAIGAELTQDEKDRIQAAPTENTEAYQHYMRGREAVRRRSPGDIQAALRFFEGALEEDEGLAHAHAGMADALILKGWAERDAGFLRPAREAAERAIAMDSLLAEAHTSRAYALFLGEWDWERAETSFQTAIRLDPNNSEARHWYGEYLSAIGNFEAAVNETSVALELDPLAPAVVCDHGSALEFLGRTPEAIGFFERCLELAPTWTAPYTNLLFSYPLVGREADALRILGRAFQVFGSSDDLAWWGSMSGMDDFQAVLSRTLEYLENGSTSGFLFLRQSFHLASLHVLAGKPDEAFGYLEAAMNEGDPAFTKRAMGDLNLAPIRDDPRFRALLQRMGLEEWGGPIPNPLGDHPRFQALEA